MCQQTADNNIRQTRSYSFGGYAPTNFFCANPNLVGPGKICFKHINKNKNLALYKCFSPQTLKRGYGPEYQIHLHLLKQQSSNLLAAWPSNDEDLVQGNKPFTQRFTLIVLMSVIA